MRKTLVGWEFEIATRHNRVECYRGDTTVNKKQVESEFRVTARRNRVAEAARQFVRFKRKPKQEVVRE